MYQFITFVALSKDVSEGKLQKRTKNCILHNTTYPTLVLCFARTNIGSNTNVKQHFEKFLIYKYGY